MTAFEKWLAAAARVAAQTRRTLPPIGMGPDGQLRLVVEGAPPWSIVIVPGDVMINAAKLSAFLFVHRTWSAD